MPVLDNVRHEKFAQEIAKGSASREAYIAAGYEGKNTAAVDASASRLLSDAKILARVSELLDKGATRAVLTVQRILDKLDRAYDLAESVKQPSTMVSAAMGQAKIAGLVVDRSEVGKPGDFESMGADELREYVRERTAALGISHKAAGVSGRERAARGKPN